MEKEKVKLTQTQKELSDFLSTDPKKNRLIYSWTGKITKKTKQKNGKYQYKYEDTDPRRYFADKTIESLRDLGLIVVDDEDDEVDSHGYLKWGTPEDFRKAKKARKVQELADRIELMKEKIRKEKVFNLAKLEPKPKIETENNIYYGVSFAEPDEDKGINWRHYGNERELERAKIVAKNISERESAIVKITKITEERKIINEDI